jgi:hypothetical protein
MGLFEIPQAVLNARPQGAKDFDFLQAATAADARADFFLFSI